MAKQKQNNDIDPSLLPKPRKPEEIQADSKLKWVDKVKQVGKPSAEYLSEITVSFIEKSIYRIKQAFNIAVEITSKLNTVVQNLSAIKTTILFIIIALVLAIVFLLVLRN